MTLIIPRRGNSTNTFPIVSSATPSEIVFTGTNAPTKQRIPNISRTTPQSNTSDRINFVPAARTKTPIIKVMILATINEFILIFIPIDPDTSGKSNETKNH